MKKRLSILALVLALVLSLAGTACADLFYTKQVNYADTAFGIIQGVKDPAVMASAIGGDSGQSIFPFVNEDGNFRVAFALFDWGSNDVIRIYAPAEQKYWNNEKTWVPAAEFTTDIMNNRGMAELDGCLYIIGYSGEWQVVKVDTAGDKYEQVGAYSFNKADYDTHAEGIFAYGGNIFVIYSFSKGSYPNFEYAPIVIKKLDPETLTEVASVELEGKNIDGGTPGAYTVSENTLYITSIGGRQSFNGEFYNEGARIEEVNLDTLEFETVVTAKQLHDNWQNPDNFKHFITGVVFKEGELWFQTTRWLRDNGEAGYNMKIYRGSVEDFKNGDVPEPIQVFQGTGGYRMGMVYDEGTDYLWIATGYTLRRHFINGWKEYTTDDIGGSISAFAAVNPKGKISANTAAI